MPTVRYRFTLSDQERAELHRVVAKGKHTSVKVINALILLNCDEDNPKTQELTLATIADVLGVSARKIERVKKRFVEEGLEPTLNGHRGERAYKKKVDGDLEARIVALSCSTPPEGHARWSLRLLADTAVELEYVDSISHEAVRRLLKKRKKTLA